MILEIILYHDLLLKKYFLLLSIFKKVVLLNFFVETMTHYQNFTSFYDEQCCCQIFI